MTAELTHEVGPRVSPERSRSFERMAASGLLLSGREEASAERGAKVSDSRVDRRPRGHDWQLDCGPR